MTICTYDVRHIDFIHSYLVHTPPRLYRPEHVEELHCDSEEVHAVASLLAKVPRTAAPLHVERGACHAFVKDGVDRETLCEQSLTTTHPAAAVARCGHEFDTIMCCQASHCMHSLGQSEKGQGQ